MFSVAPKNLTSWRRIYDAAAPSLTSVMDIPTQTFLEDVIQIVNDAVEEAGGSVEGIAERDSAKVA